MVSKRKPEADEHRGDHDQYESLEAEAVADEAEARHEADELDDITANFPLDEDVESASPDEVEVPTLSGDDLEEIVRERPADERVPPENYDQPIIRAPDAEQPTTQDHVPGDIDSQGDWPDE